MKKGTKTGPRVRVFFSFHRLLSWHMFQAVNGTHAKRDTKYTYRLTARKLAHPEGGGGGGGGVAASVL